MYTHPRQTPYPARDIETGMLSGSALRTRACSDGGWSSGAEEDAPKIYLIRSPPATPEKPPRSKFISMGALDALTMVCWSIAFIATTFLIAYLVGIIPMPGASAPMSPINCFNGTRRCERAAYDDKLNMAAIGYIPLPQNGA